MARILVVDDDHNILQVLRMRLVSDGHHVTIASDSAEALARSQNEPGGSGADRSQTEK